MNRPVHLYWGARSRVDLYLPELPERWASDNPNFHYIPVLSQPDAEWRGETGLVHETVVTHHPDLSNHEIYMSDLPPMIQAGMDVFLARLLHLIPETIIFYDLRIV